MIFQRKDGELLLGEPLNHGDNVTSIAWHPAGNLLASGGDDGKVLLWVDPLTNPDPIERYTRGERIHCIAFSPDGEKLVAGCHDGSIKLWFGELGTDKWFSESRLWPWDFDTNYKHAGAVLSLAFHPSGHVLVSCGDDKTIRFWDAHTLTFLSELIVDSKISSSTFNPLGNTLAIGTEGDRRTFIFGEHIPPSPVPI